MLKDWLNSFFVKLVQMTCKHKYRYTLTTRDYSETYFHRGRRKGQRVFHYTCVNCGKDITVMRKELSREVAG